MFMYLIPTMGISVTMHYCGGKVSSVSIISYHSKCSCGKKAMKKDCCKDKTTFLKLKDTQNFSKSVVSNFSQTFKLLYHSITLYKHNLTEDSFVNNLLYSHPTPLQKSEPLYLLDRVFLI